MTTPSRSESRKAVRGRRSYSLMIGTGLLGVIVLAAILAPWITPYDPLAHDLDTILAPPSSDHLLGTDHLGRDVWTRLLYAARLDLLIGVGAVITPFLTGTLLGAVAGYYGGRIDLAVSAATDMLMAFPYYVLIIALVFSLGPGIPSIFIAMAIVAWVSYARIVRGEVLSARGQQYVMAAKTLGYTDLRIIVRHILPNVITQPVTYAMSDIVVIIVGVVTLSYLGLGVPPPTPDWGSMIASGQSFMTTQWQLSTIPGIAVVIVGLSFSLIGDGLTHRLRPE
ncbi:MAG: ABC transporter permease [bacterium]|nr:ABC transporter permease [Acidimicrobiia bacterium]MCY4651163.1 ABC transporter permease [bacterium]